MSLLHELGRHTEFEAPWLLGRFCFAKDLLRIRDIRPSPDSGWQVEAQRLYPLAVQVSVQYRTCH